MSLVGPLPSIVANSLLYKEFMEEREEILKHKWIESEKKGYDIGFDRAISEWIIKYRTQWRNYKKLFNSRN